MLVVGGGQAGLAARLGNLGIDTLIVDRNERIGDNWRNRYHSLTLHNEVHVNHLPYMPFPPTWPVFIPKDKLANWFESYVESLELNFWTGTELVNGRYERGAGLAGHPAPVRRPRARPAAPSHGVRDRRQQHSPTAIPAGSRLVCRRRPAFGRLHGRWRLEGAQGARARHRQQRPRRRPGPARAASMSR